MTVFVASLTERIVRRERMVIISALVCVTLLSWLYILSGAGTGMSAVNMTTVDFPAHMPLVQFHSEWSATYAVMMLTMWWVMMIAMMLPSAAPMILLYGRVVRNSAPLEPRSNILATAYFAGGYVMVWLLFSLAAVVLQWLLERLGVMHGLMMWSTSTILSAALLISAGLYQLSSLKAVCLRHCRSPVEFIASHWRQGHMGALRMGVEHGVVCVGCCWALMTLLFVGGAMNLVWIAGLSAVVLIEKLLPKGGISVYLTAVVLGGSSIFLLVAAIL